MGIEGQAVAEVNSAIGQTEAKIFVRVQYHTLAAFFGQESPAFLADSTVPKLLADVPEICCRLGCWQRFPFHHVHKHARVAL